MYRTLELVNAALARVQSDAAGHREGHGQPPDVRRVSDHGLQPDLGHDSADKLWELANYELKPRLNRQTGVSSVVVQGGQVPEFEVQPDPAKLVQAGVTIPNILDAISRSNMIDSPGLIEANHQLVLSLVSGQARTADGHRRTSSSRPLPPARRCASATWPPWDRR